MYVGECYCCVIRRRVSLGGLDIAGDAATGIIWYSTPGLVSVIMLRWKADATTLDYRMECVFASFLPRNRYA